MLVLQRKPGESLVFSHPAFEEDITVTICETSPSLSRLKIGISAPTSVEIRRGELPSRARITEQAPETFYSADRERAKIGLSELQLAYVERLEMALRANDKFWTVMQTKPMTPKEYALSNAVLEANALVNFCSEQDMVELPDCFRDEENELPRDVIFS